MPRRPGQKEERWGHRLGGEAASGDASDATPATVQPSGDASDATPATVQPSGVAATPVEGRLARLEERLPAPERGPPGRGGPGGGCGPPGSPVRPSPGPPPGRV